MAEVCECEVSHGLFIWRGDPDWWSCMCCDGRVREITAADRAHIAERDAHAKTEQQDGAA